MSWQLTSCPPLSHFDLRMTELKVGLWGLCSWNNVKRIGEALPKKLKVTFMDPGQWSFKILVIHLQRCHLKERKIWTHRYVLAKLSITCSHIVPALAPAVLTSRAVPPPTPPYHLLSGTDFPSRDQPRAPLLPYTYPVLKLACLCFFIAAGALPL